MTATADTGDIFFEAAEALRVLFLDYQKSLHDEPGFFRSAHPELLVTLDQAFFNAQNPAGIGDCVEALNELVRLTPGQTLLEVLEDEFFEMLINRQVDIADYLRSGSMNFEQIEFFRQNFLDLEKGITALRIFADSKRVNPAVRGCLAGRSVLNETPEKILSVALLRDPFARSRTFRYINEEFRKCTVENIPVNKFFGFHGVRSNFDEHLRNFAAGKGNVVHEHEQHQYGHAAHNVNIQACHPLQGFAFAHAQVAHGSPHQCTQ